MSLSISASHDFGRGAAEVAAISPRLSAAWREATAEATGVVASSIEDAIADRTGMSSEAVSRIVEADVAPSAGDRSSGRVGLANPPERFYPKTAKALSFLVGGRRVTVRSVKGSRPYKLVGRGAEAAEEPVREVYREKVREAMRG